MGEISADTNWRFNALKHKLLSLHFTVTLHSHETNNTVKRFEHKKCPGTCRGI